MIVVRTLRRLLDRPYVLLGFATLSWGGNTVAGRLAVGQVSPMMIVCLRWSVVVLILAVAARRQVAAEWPALRAAWFKVFLMGALAYTGFNAIFYWAAHYTTAVNLGMIQGVTPAMVLALSFAVYRTPIGAKQWVGLLATLLGIGVVASRGDIAVLRHLTVNAGDLGIVVASLLYAGYTVALRTRPAVSPLTLFSGMAGAAFVSSLPLVVLEILSGAAQWPTPEGWLLVLYIGLIPSLVAQLSYMRGVELIGPGRAGLFMNLIPVFAAVLGVAVLGEAFGLYHAVALVLVLGGIWLAERAGRMPPATPSDIAPGGREAA